LDTLPTPFCAFTGTFLLGFEIKGFAGALGLAAVLAVGFLPAALAAGLVAAALGLAAAGFAADGFFSVDFAAAGLAAAGLAAAGFAAAGLAAAGFAAAGLAVDGLAEALEALAGLEDPAAVGFDADPEGADAGFFSSFLPAGLSPPFPFVGAILH